MQSNVFKNCASLAVLGISLGLAAPALGQSRQITSPNTTNADTAASVTLNGEVFVNQGLIGAGRLDANTRDFAGETMGSFSSMALDLKTWRRNADGSYVGTLYTLPDRGPNDVGPFVGTTNYRNRVHISQISLRPYTGTAALPQTTTSQNQLTITPTGGYFLTDTTGANFTGKDALGNVVTRDGKLLPVVPTGSEGAGRISLDSEGIAYRPDGTFYVSDEYAANIYYFDPSGRLLGVLNTIPAISPKIAGAVNFNGALAPDTGRRNNQGMEAIAITPDNRKLVTILQSATIQDTNGANQQTRNNTRILVYDINGNAVPSANPTGHYVLQLPTFTSNGNGSAVNRTAAQSEMMALNDSQFLVLSRDGNGRGSGNGPIVFKSVLLVDTTGATNLAGTQYESGVTPIATNGTLASGIVPVSQVELVNMLNPVQLGRFGMNLNATPSTITSLSEKWEALALAPVLEEAKPQDFFLFVGNDNDFQANNGLINGQTYDASLTGAGGTGNNDSVILVYRLSLPTYVDPQALSALNLTAPNVLYGTRIATSALGAAASQPAMRFLNGQRGFAASDGRRMQLWIDGDWSKVGAGASPLAGLDARMRGGTLGFDYRAGENARIGMFGGYRKLDGNLAAGARFDAEAWTFGAYAAYNHASGFYGQASVGILGGIKLERLTRASAYGQTAQGSTKGSGFAASGEIGYLMGNERLTYGPFAALDYSDIKLDGYTESGASVSNLVFPDRKNRKLTATLGAEIATRIGSVRPSLRGGYSMEKESGDHSATVRLASAKHSMASVPLALATTERDSAFGELRLAVQEGPISGYLVGRGRWGRGEDDARISIGVGYAF